MQSAPLPLLVLLVLLPIVTVLADSCCFPSQVPCCSTSPFLCWYHHSHGELVQKYIAPCCWSGNAFYLPASASGSSLIYIRDLLSSRRFLVDSGASVSLFPSLPSTSCSSVKFYTADSSSLTCSGSQIIPYRFDWPFQLALISLPILWADFLCHHKLLLEVFSSASPGSPEINLNSAASSSSSGLGAYLLYTPQCISNLLSEFPDVPSYDSFMASPPHHQIPHHLLTLPGPQNLTI